MSLTNSIPRTHLTSFEEEVALGYHSNFSLVNILGCRWDGLSANAFKDVILGASAYTWPTVASGVLVSGGANDSSSGTGARTVFIEGLDVNFNIITETVTLTGAGPVSTIQSFYRINNAHVVTAGSLGWNDLAINMKINGVQAGAIPQNFNNRRDAIFTVPANYNLLLTMLGGFSRTTGLGFLRVETRDTTITNAAFQKQVYTGVGATTNGPTKLGAPILLGPKTDVKCVVIAGSNATNDHCKSILSGYLIKQI